MGYGRLNVNIGIRLISNNYNIGVIMSISIEEMAALIKREGLGTQLGLMSKITSYCSKGEIRKLRNTLIAVKLAFPNRRVSDTFGEKLMKECRDTLQPYYAVNPHWKEGDNKWTLFIKIKEPPEGK
jgi:hypothetical protein